MIHSLINLLVMLGILLPAQSIKGTSCVSDRLYAILFNADISNILGLLLVMPLQLSAVHVVRFSVSPSLGMIPR